MMKNSTTTKEEKDLISQSAHKPFMETNYRDTVTNKQTFTYMDFDYTLFSTLILEEENDSPSNHPNFIPSQLRIKLDFTNPGNNP